MNLKMKITAINQAKGYFTGGGNTFLLVKTLHEENLMKRSCRKCKIWKTLFGNFCRKQYCRTQMKTTK